MLATARAAAAPHAFEPAALSWVRAGDATSCPSAGDMARAVDARLGGDALVPLTAASLVVEASIHAKSGGGFHVHIALARGNDVVGQRELESEAEDCEPIAEQAALVIALTIDPEASPRPGPIERSPAPSPQPTVVPRRPPEPAPPPPLRTPPSRPAAAPEPWSGELEGALGLASGTVPEVSPGVFLRGRVRPPGLPAAFELESGYFFRKQLEVAPGRGASFESFFVGGAICTQPPRGPRLYATVCGGPEVIAVTGRGYGFEWTPRFMSFTAALAARGRLGVRPARGLSVVLGPDLTVPLGRDRFQTVTPARTDELFRMTAVGVGFELGGVWEF